MLIVRDRRNPGPRSLASGPSGVHKPFPLSWGVSRHYCGHAPVTLTCVVAHVTSYRCRNGSETVSLAAWQTQPGRAVSGGAQAESPPPGTESPPSACSLRAHPQPSPTSPRLGKGCGAPLRCSFSGPSKCLFVFQAVRFSCQGSKSSCLRWRVGQKRSHLGPHKCPHSLQWAKQGQRAAINASLTRPASQPEPSLNQTTVQGSWVPTREPGGQTGWAGSLRGGTRGWVSSPTPSVCGRERTARNGLPGILLMIGFAFTPRGSYWGLGSN